MLTLLLVLLSLQICVMECEGTLLSSATWGLCRKITTKVSLPLALDRLEEAAARPLEVWDGSLRGKIRHLSDLTRAGDVSKAASEKRVTQVSGVLHHQAEAEDGASDGSQTLQGDFQDQMAIPKRLDFLTGPFRFEQMAAPEVQELQKRFGGFIGVRKSARKWHNQKRFSEFLKQYLGMSPRSIDYDSFADDDLKEQNEI